MNSSPSQPKPAKPGIRPTGFRANHVQSAPSSRPKHAGKTGSLSSAPKNQPSAQSAASVTGNPATAPAVTARNAPPIKKRAKGSGFIGFIFVSGFIIAGYLVWSSLLQYQSYGLIEGRVISVAAPWDGSVASWEVRDGEEVKQGQVLAQIKNLDMEHELATLGDELKMNQAILEAEMSKIKFEVQSRTEQNQKSLADYHENYGQLLSEQETYKELNRKLDRARRLLKSNTISRSAYEEIYFKFAGQKKRIAQLVDAVEVLKIRSQNIAEQSTVSPRLKPILSKIQLTQYKIERLREKIGQGNIKAPVSGRVSKRHRLTGEAANASEVVIDILEDNSIEAVLYLPQKVVNEYEVGKIVEVSIEPYSHSIRCRVERFGDRFVVSPPTIERYYQVNQPLLPVYLSPIQDTNMLLSAKIGGTIKRPYNYAQSAQRVWEDGRRFVSSFLGPKPYEVPTATDIASIETPQNTYVQTDTANEEVSKPADIELHKSAPRVTLSPLANVDSNFDSAATSEVEANNPYDELKFLEDASPTDAQLIAPIDEVQDNSIDVPSIDDEPLISPSIFESTLPVVPANSPATSIGFSNNVKPKQIPNSYQEVPPFPAVLLRSSHSIQNQ